MYLRAKNSGRMVVYQQEPMCVFYFSHRGNRPRLLKKMPQGHDFVCVWHVLRVRAMQDERLTVMRYLKVAVRFASDLAEVFKQGKDLTPFQIVRDRVLKDSVVGAQMRAVEIRWVIHICKIVSRRRQHFSFQLLGVAIG